jgi:hypothetical protein
VKILNVPEEGVDIVCIDMLSLEYALEALNRVSIIIEDFVKLFELRS